MPINHTFFGIVLSGLLILRAIVSPPYADLCFFVMIKSNTISASPALPQLHVENIYDISLVATSP